MKVEQGDFIQFEGIEPQYGVVLHVETKPYGMGHTYTVIDSEGSIEEVEDRHLVADFDRTLSMHHKWTRGQQAEYDSLSCHGRRLYDQIRTRCAVGHRLALGLAVEHTPAKGAK